MRTDDEIDALREVHRVASDRIDERPDASVRAAVLAAAARGVDARPRLAQTQAQPSKTRTTGPFRTRRWPLSAAAVLVVSVLTGVIATHALQDRPERVTTVASSEPMPLVEKVTPADAKAHPAGPLAATIPARNARPKTTIDESRRRDPQGAAGPSNPAPSTAASVPLQMASPAPAPEAPQEDRAKADADASTTLGTEALAEATAARPVDTGAARPASAPRAARTRIGRIAEPVTPAAWIERIMKLRADGNDLEADRELEALRRRYPGLEIPSGALTTSGTR